MGNQFDFGEAIRRMKAGERVCRAGWNGKGMWLMLLKPENPTHTSEAGTFELQPCIGMKNAQGTMQPGWLANQPDFLAEDWCVAT